MILDTFICDFLLKRKINYKAILVLFSFYYIFIYSLLYLIVIKKAFKTQNVLIPSLIISIFFLAYRIKSIKKYIKEQNS